MFGFLASLALLYGGGKLAPYVGLTDQPGGRKQHKGAVSLIGGLVIMPVFTALYFQTVPGAVADWPLFAGVFVLLVTGAVDDARQIHPFAKLAVQIWVACFVVIFGGADLEYPGDLFGFGPIELGVYSKPFSVACLVLFMNALNMMDGVDGLAGGISAMILLCLMVVCAYAGLWGALAAVSMLLAPLLAFLVFNMRHPWRRRAGIFLGDAGSLTLALVIGWLCIHLSQARIPDLGGPALKPIAAAWLLALPVMDVVALFFLRLLKGQHPFNPDRNHLHHRFLDRGIPVGWTVAILMLAVAGGAAAGIGGSVIGVPDVVLLAGWIGLLSLYILYSLRPSAVRHFESQDLKP